MTNEANNTKKEKQSKDKCTTAKDLGALQKDYEGEVWKHLLYLSPDGPIGEQLAHGTFMGEGESRGLLEVRLKSLTPSVLQLQYKQGRNGSGLLLKNVKGDGEKENGTTPKRQTGDRKSI